MPSSALPNRVPQYPVNLELVGRRCLVVGAGNVATRKIQGLVAAGAAVTVVGPEIHAAIRQLSVELADSAQDRNRGPMTIVERRYEPADLDGVWLVIACTDDPDVNHGVFVDAEAAHIWSNSADDPINCAFTLPSVARQGDLQVTASTRGRSPALSMWLRRRFEAEFDSRWSDLLDVLADVRAEARSTLGTSEIAGWIEALDGGVAALVMDGDTASARSLLRDELGLASGVSETSVKPDAAPIGPVGVGEFVRSSDLVTAR